MFRFKSHWPKGLMKALGVKYGKNLSLYGYPYIFKGPKGTIRIGDNCTFRSDPMSNMLGMMQRTYIISKYKGKVIIGNSVGISGSTIYSWKSIKIGDYTIVGSGSKIMDTDFHPIDSELRKKAENDKARSEPVEIGENVFIGCNCIILKGTKIGNNCVIGAGSVVHGEFPDDCLIAGNPAKIIKKI